MLHEYITHSCEETQALGTAISRTIKPQDIILFEGDLGTGKSTLCRSIIQTLAPNTTHVPSPTFTLINIYDTPQCTLWHMDLYRLNNDGELRVLGFDEALQDNVCFLIEWPQIIKKSPPQAKRILLCTMRATADRTRHITLQSIGCHPFPTPPIDTLANTR